MAHLTFNHTVYVPSQPCRLANTDLDTGVLSLAWPDCVDLRGETGEATERAGEMDCPTLPVVPGPASHLRHTVHTERVATGQHVPLYKERERGGGGGGGKEGRGRGGERERERERGRERGREGERGREREREGERGRERVLGDSYITFKH